jgi:uncharacterized protein YbjT (DUF2867 family)
MKKRVALVIGASGLVGKQVVQQLSESNQYAKVKVLLRSKMVLEHPKIEQIIIDFNKISALTLTADDIFCCLGTTMANAGSKEAFYKVDFTFPLEIAKRMLQNGAETFAIVTAMGASASSFVYYNKVKGQIEDTLKSLDYQRLVIVRPSMLLGERQEKRLGETIGKVLMKSIDFLTPKKYKAVYDKQVAAAMIHAVLTETKKLQIIESDKLQDF